MIKNICIVSILQFSQKYELLLKTLSTEFSTECSYCRQSIFWCAYSLSCISLIIYKTASKFKHLFQMQLKLALQ